MKFKTKACIVMALMAGCFCSQTAMAEEKAEKTPARAAWIMPLEGQAPWLDMRTVDMAFETPEVLATGGNLALVRHSDGHVYAMDARLNRLGRIELPANAGWIHIDEASRILVHDGKRLLAAQSWEDAVKADGFVAVLDMADVRMIDGAGGVVAYADGTHLVMVDLNSGQVRRIPVADFFNDAKCALMTPEAVLAAEKAASKKKKKKQAPVVDSGESVVADVTGIWWRQDGTGVVRLRSLLNIRTFVTKDAGRSWTEVKDFPKTMVHSYGWIWDGVDRVLSADGLSWVQVCGPKVSVADRLTTTSHLEMASALPSDWLGMASPVLPSVSASVDGSVSAESAASETGCHAVSMLPMAASESQKARVSSGAALYAPEVAHSGLRVGLYRNAVCSALSESGCTGEVQAPEAWQILPGGKVEPMTLPEGCLPLYVGSDRGLGVLMCEAPEDEVTVYVRTADSEWAAETILSRSFARDTRMMMAEDGSLVLTGACANETIEISVPTVSDPDSEVMSVPVTETRTVEVCRAAVRLPEAISQPDIWRIERIENVHGYVPLKGGQLLTIEAPEPAQRRLVLRATDKTETVVEHFDPSPWKGLVMTGEGCLALYDGSLAPEVLQSSMSPVPDPETGVVMDAMPVKLLSVDGKLAELDCASSRAVSELLAGSSDPVSVSKGEDRYGIRVAAGGFFTTNDVQTWFARAEVLFPIYHGGYEVGLMYRLGGGNTSTSFGHLGIVSVRWRYDDLELFDFAVGAGIGYGSMCGYDKSADPAANDDDDSTVPSGFAQCNQLSMRYLISGIAAYEITSGWKVYVGAELLGGSDWGFDISGGLEVRF